MNWLAVILFSMMVAVSLMALGRKACPFAFLLRHKLRDAAILAREHHEEVDVSNWRWQECREALVFRYNWTRRFPNQVEAEYHELFILNSEGEAVDLVSPRILWQRAIHLGLLKLWKTGPIPIAG